MVQQWHSTSEVGRVGGLRRNVVAHAAEHGVPRAVLSDLAIALGEVLANVLLHGGAHDRLTVSAEVREADVVVVVTGAGFGLSERVNGPGIRLGMVVVATLADSVRVSPTPDGGREVSLTLGRATGDGRRQGALTAALAARS